MEITELVERLERVEKANQRLRLAGGAMLAVLLGIALVGAVMPEQRPRSIIDARMFRVYDENNTLRATMTAAGFVHMDENGKGSVGMDSHGFRYFDENGEVIWQVPER